MKIGLALAGGGLQAISYIGAIQAFNGMGIKFDYISGTSSGSLFALLYALGFTPDEMKKLVINKYQNLSKIENKTVFKIAKDYVFDKEIKTEGLIDGIRIENLVDEILAKKNVKNMADISMPIAIPTVDTITTKECISISTKNVKEQANVDYIYNIPISKAIRASMSFPGIVTTCDYDRYNFIDGGTKDNLPIQVLKDMGADVTIGLSFDISKYNKTNSFFNVMLRAVDIYSQRDVVKAQKQADLAIEIDTKGSSLLTMGDNTVEQCIYAGYATIRKYSEYLEKCRIKNSAICS